VLSYTDRRRIEQLCQIHGGRLRIVDERSVYLTLSRDGKAPDRLLGQVKSVLRPT
jgi:hypothetical protein